ncbi:MAG TPA: sterol desaturase family protein, partial [Hyphomonadaceae bacterium]|nr:sterol desaturase family protein [Hyphomonadaceae bacterium]
ALPPFSAWQSGTLPYPVLVLSQFAIIVASTWAIIAISRGKLGPSPRIGLLVLVAGILYFSFMAFRLVAGLTFLKDSPFFGVILPAVFHLVLASMLIIVGLHLRRQTLRSMLRLVIYPAVMAGSLFILWLLLDRGAALAWAPYAAIAIAGPVILIAERLIPYREEWRPRLRDFALDGVFMAMTQVALPMALTWLAVLGLQTFIAGNGLSFNIWPSSWPILAQLALKVIAGDFLRYWLHRAAHTWTPLWRLHEVHHHPGKLYTTNVFRFHPLEKSLQFLADTLPFMLVGIGPEVLAWYFVFYAVSGLFQHSNIDVRLGPLNYVFSGPEVHRWHHSQKIAESNNNYAHSFVVWDIVFGTYFRPHDRKVETLGLLDANYPKDFLRQMGAPFRARPNAP